VAWPLNAPPPPPVFNSPQVFPISCRESETARPPSLSSSPSSSRRLPIPPPPPPPPPLPSTCLFRSLAVYPSIRVLSSRSPLPRVHSCLPVARTSLPTVNGFVPSVRALPLPPAPLLEILVTRDVVSPRYAPLPPPLCLDHLLPFLKIFLGRLNREPKDAGDSRWKLRASVGAGRMMGSLRPENVSISDL